MSEFINSVKQFAAKQRNSIIPIPNSCIIDKNYLGDLTNEEFIDIFSELQQLIMAMYNDIEKDPLVWGFPEEPKSKDLDYHRLIECIFALMTNGQFNVNKVTVDTSTFLKAVKAFANIDLTLKMLEKFGFSINGFSKKSSLFTIFHTNSDLLRILHLYENIWDMSLPHWSYYFTTFEHFSYRWIEDKSTQSHETIFLAMTDEYSDKLKEMQYWLYEQAKKYGFSIDLKTPYEKGCIRYCKGSKGFFLIGEKNVDGENVIFSKTIFRKVFDKHIQKMSELINLFPETFGANKYSLCNLCNGSKNGNDECSMRISYTLNDKNYKNCAYRSFYFQNINIDNIIVLFNMFIIENNLKTV